MYWVKLLGRLVDKELEILCDLLILFVSSWINLSSVFVVSMDNYKLDIWDYFATY